MQIFAVYRDPVACARYLDDVRGNKIIVESAQMLSTAIRVHASDYLSEADNLLLYRKANPNHPVTKWVAQTRANFLWTCEYHAALCREKIARTGRGNAAITRFGFGQDFIRLAHCIPDGPLLPPANCAARRSLGIDFRHVRPVTLAYRQYLDARWLRECETDQYHPCCTIPTHPTFWRS